MKAVVRDDIIELHSFVAAKFKYEKYLFEIYDAGNYCFMDQFCRFYKNGPYLIKCMQEYNLVEVKTLNTKYNYILLTQTAMKYLKLKDDPKDFSDLSKNQINVTRVNINPSTKVLITSALKYDLILNSYNFAISNKMIYNLIENYLKTFNFIDDSEGCNSSLQELKELYNSKFKEYQILKSLFSNSEFDFLKMSVEDIIELYNSDKLRYSYLEMMISKIKDFNIQFSDIKKQVDEYRKRLEWNENHPLKNQAREIQRKLQNYYDKSKLLFEYNNFVLTMYILDTSNFKSVWQYMSFVKELQQTGLKYKYLDIVVVSYSETRAQYLKGEFEKALSASLKADRKMKIFETEKKLNRNYRKQWKYEPPRIYLEAEKIYNQLRGLRTISIYDKAFYMSGYMYFTDTGLEYLKDKDALAIEKIINDLNSNFD